jgi:acyl carrier protein
MIRDDVQPEVWTDPDYDISDATAAATTAVSPARTATDIETWLIAYIARSLEVEANELDPTVPFDRYGLASAAAYEMMGDLETWLGIPFDPTLPYDYPTIRSLSAHLAEAQGLGHGAT